jgi:hypothetical protein
LLPRSYSKFGEHPPYESRPLAYDLTCWFTVGSPQGVGGCSNVFVLVGQSGTQCGEQR